MVTAHQTTEPAPAAADAAGLRDAHGRFRPGRSGNPKGKPPGPHRTSVLARVLREGELETIGRKLIESALADNNLVTGRWLVDRVEPRARGRAIDLELPPEATVADGAREVLWRTLEGRITPDEALQLQRIIERTPMAPAVAVEATEAPSPGSRADAPEPPSPAMREREGARAAQPRGKGEGPEFDLNFQAIAREAARPRVTPGAGLMARPATPPSHRAATAIGAALATARLKPEIVRRPPAAA
jgi:hypothetical protein